MQTRVLVAESDIFVATDLAVELETRGMAISGIVSSLAGTLRAIDEKRPDFALLNIVFQDGDSYSAAQRLRSRGIPFAFLTGFEDGEIASEFRDVPRLSKPQESTDIAATVVNLVAASSA